MFCTKSKLLTQITVLKLSSFSLSYFFISADCCEAYKLTDLQKLSTLIGPELFQFL